MNFFKRKQSEIQLHPGVRLIESRAGDQERRLYTLLLKGVIVYLVVMGQTGCLLSALSISYNIYAVNAGVLLGALFCALLYYSKLWENLGYILLFIFMLGSAIALRNYISSGFFAIVNNMAEKAALYFGTSVIQGFRERLSDRYTTVTISCIYIGWVNAILFNVIISRRMKYLVATFLSVIVLFVPLYLEREPSILYTVMLMSGLVMTFAYRGGGHFEITDNNDRYILNKKKNNISFVYDAKTGWTTLGAVVVVCFAVAGIFGVMYPKERYAAVREEGLWREATHDSAENLYKLGIWGIFNLYPNTGGLSSGVLGGVNSVQLDYETDLVVTMVPYKNQRVYLKSFTGASYLPFENRWNRKMVGDQPEMEETRTDIGENLREIFRSGSEVSLKDFYKKSGYTQDDLKTAKAKIKVENLDAPIGVYLPYYMYSIQNADAFVINLDKSQIMEFYPLLDENLISKYNYYKNGNLIDLDTLARLKKIVDETDVDDHTSINEKEFIEEKWEGAKSRKIEELERNYGLYMEVPQENKETIDEVISDIGFEEATTKKKESVRPEEIAKRLQEYFYEKMPYSYQPGLTPYKKDFVNYFLQENKKGYCAHFASASTLIFRELGIPARYVEGYVVDPSDIAQDSSLASGAKSEDYYEGYNPIGDQPVVDVEVTDASAHAWVEAYDESVGGWVVCEVTPPSDEEGPSIGLFAGLLGLLSGRDSDEASGDTADIGGITDAPDASGVIGMADSFGRAVGIFFLSSIGLVGLIILLRMLIRKIRYEVRYARADRSARLIMDYERYRKKVKNMPRELINYRSQIGWLRDNVSDPVDDNEAKIIRDDGIKSIKNDGTKSEFEVSNSIDSSDKKLIEILEYADFSGREISKEEYDEARRLLDEG